MATRFAQAGVEAAIQSIASLRVAQVGVEVAYLPVGNIPAKATSLAAYYQTGWFGNDSPDLMKMFRFGHIGTRKRVTKLTGQFVDDENYTFNTPPIVLLKMVSGIR